MALSLRSLAPCFAASLIGCASAGGGMAVPKQPATLSAVKITTPKESKPAAHTEPTPETYDEMRERAEKFIAARGNTSAMLPQKITGWRHAFVIHGETDADTKAATSAMDKIFSNPEVMSALVHRVAENRAASAALHGIDSDTARHVAETARMKTVILASHNPAIDTGFESDDIAHVGERAVWLNPVIRLQTGTQSEYMGIDGKYHADSTTAAAAHEIAHLLTVNPSREQENTDLTNKWMSVIDIGYAMRGNYYMVRAAKDGIECQMFNDKSLATATMDFNAYLNRQRDPADPAPVITDAAGRVLKGGDAARRMSVLFYANCAQ